MPTWSELGKELDEARADESVLPNHEYDHVRRKHLVNLSQYTKRDTILYATNWTHGSVPDPYMISINDEDIQGLMEVVHGLKKDKLDLILHSPGGTVEAAEAIVQYLRKKFVHIRAIIPQAAMSAATMIACGCDEIVMGKQSSLGPIDPQVILAGRHDAIPTQDILDQFELAQEQCMDPDLLGSWLPILGSYGPGLLVQCKNAQALSKQLAAKWLRENMFKDLGKEERSRRASKVARWLASHTSHKSHSRHLDRDALEAKGLKIINLEDDQRFQDLALTVFHAVNHTFNGTQAMKIIENHNGRCFVRSVRMLTFNPIQMAGPIPTGPSVPLVPVQLPATPQEDEPEVSSPE